MGTKKQTREARQQALRQALMDWDQAQREERETLTELEKAAWHEAWPAWHQAERATQKALAAAQRVRVPLAAWEQTERKVPVRVETEPGLPANRGGD